MDSNFAAFQHAGLARLCFDLSVFICVHLWFISLQFKARAGRPCYVLSPGQLSRGLAHVGGDVVQMFIGVPLVPRQHQHTFERLEQLYGPAHTLEFENCQDGGLAVTVAVPYRT